MKSYSPNEVFEKMENNEDILLLDIRSDNEIINGIIPNSLHLPIHLFPLRANDFPTNKEIIVYCHVGGRSASAVRWLEENGFNNAADINGGIVAWVRSGLEAVPNSGNKF